MMAAVDICLKPAQRQLIPALLLIVTWGCKLICQTQKHKYKTSPVSDVCIHEEYIHKPHHDLKEHVSYIVS